MTNDLVERLRKGDGNYLILTDEAADEIETLRSQLAAADRMAEEVDRLLSIEGPIWEEDWGGIAKVLWRYKETRNDG